MNARLYWYDDETDSWADIQKRQATLLPEFVRRLQLRSGLYAHRLAAVRADAATSVDALVDLPFTTKDDLRDGQAVPVPGAILGTQQCAATDDLEQVISSSGTTGVPVYFGQTAHDRAEWTDAIAAMFFTAGVGPTSVAALSTGMPMVAGGLPYADGIRNTGAALVWFGGQPTARMVTALERVSVNTLIATASFATYFSKKVDELAGAPARSLNIRTIVAGGEPGAGQPEVRSAIADAWGAERVSEVMGLGDVLSGMWAECDAGGGMHFTAYRSVLVELIDPTSESQIEWSEGACGELVYTTLTREATPVLRFRSRDHIVVTGIDCPCGRRTPRIRCIGRTDDMLIYKAMNVFPSAIRDVALSVAAGMIEETMRLRKSSVDQVRFDYPIPLEVELKTPLDDARTHALSEKIQKAVQERLRVRVAVEIKKPGTIEVGVYKNSLTYVAQ